MRPNYTLSGKKISPDKEPIKVQVDMLYALNIRQYKGKEKMFEGTSNPKRVAARRRKTYITKLINKSRRGKK